MNKTQRHAYLALKVVVLSTLLVSPPAKAQDSNTSRWAVLIGVNDYTELTDLQFCSNDMQALRDQLVASGFPKDQVFLLHDDAKDRKYLPFRNNIAKHLEFVMMLADQGDTVVIGFSGHGQDIDGKSYLCPSDADPGDSSTLIPLDAFHDRIEESRSDLAFLLLDVHRAVSFNVAETGEAGPAGGLLRKEQTSTNRVEFWSSRPGQQCVADPEIGRSIFMHYVLEALRGKADRDQNDKVSLMELLRFTNRHTKLHVTNKFNGVQTPLVVNSSTLAALDFSFAVQKPDE